MLSQICKLLLVPNCQSIDRKGNYHLYYCCRYHNEKRVRRFYPGMKCFHEKLYMAMLNNYTWLGDGHFSLVEGREKQKPLKKKLHSMFNCFETITEDSYH